MPIAVRGAGYESEWASNVTLGISGEAEGFASAANQVLSSVKQYIENNDLEEKINSGKVKFWVAGYSRAGATANLTSARLINNYAQFGNQVYGYCFEAPQGGIEEENADMNQYNSIHNCINKTDVVPLVGPT